MAEQLYSEILPNLWQGGTDDFDTINYPKSSAFNQNPHQWQSVATLYAVAHPMGWGVREQRFGFPDDVLELSNTGHINEIAEWLHKEWKQGRKVLARCQAGWNRSGLVIGLILLKEGYSADEAIELIRSKRSPYALCNPDFVRYLRKDMGISATA
jgi:hypothetical protein